MELNNIWEQGGAGDRDIALCDSLAGPSWPSGSMALGFSLAGPSWAFRSMALGFHGEHNLDKDKKMKIRSG